MTKFLNRTNMVDARSFVGLLLAVLLLSLAGSVSAAEPNAASGWEPEWNRTVKAAEQEGQLVLYSLTEVGEAISNTGFQKKFPKSKVSVISARGGEHISRIMAERRAGKFLADIGSLGNTSPY